LVLVLRIAAVIVGAAQTRHTKSRHELLCTHTLRVPYDVVPRLASRMK
jgi:hypothetical protein